MSRIVKRIIVTVSILFLVLQLVITQYAIFASIELQTVHLGFALTLVFLASIAETKKKILWIPLLILLISSWVVTAYIFMRFEHLEIAMGLPDRYDLIIGIILVFVVLEATRQSWGLIFPLIISFFILYFFFGQYFPWGLSHSGFKAGYVISNLGIGFRGIFGDFLNASVQYVFLFMVLGGVLKATGSLEFIMELGKAIGRVTAGGPAQTAVVGSGLVGTISGVAVSNVVLTGSFTIPAMKSIGYKPDYAGAIESTASTGGQIMPPVMGVAAFVMAEVTGIPYREIMVAAIVPALLYYFQVFVSVEAIARKEKISAHPERINIMSILRRSPPFVLTIIILFVLLIRMVSPSYAAFYAIFAALAVAFLQKETRPTWSTLIDNIVDGVMVGAKVAIILAAVGMIAITLIVTVLGIKLTGLAEAIAGGQVFILLLLTMIISIILGCGVPTIGAYVLVALIVAPVLTRMGFTLLPVHFFAFYFAVLSAITPPVALASVAAAGISGGNPWRTGLHAFALATGGFVIPFFILFNPSLMLLQGGFATISLSILAAAIVFLCLTAIIWGHLLAPIGLVHKVPYAICAIIFGFFAVYPTNYLAFATGAVIIAGLLVVQWRNSRITAA